MADAEVVVLYQTQREELEACIRFWDRFIAGEVGPRNYTLTDEDIASCRIAQQQAREALAALDEDAS